MPRPLITWVALSCSFGKREPVPVQSLLYLLLADILNELILLVLLPLVVLVELQLTLLRHGCHPLGAEAARKHGEDAEDKERGSPGSSAQALGRHLVDVGARHEHLLVVLVGPNIQLPLSYLWLDDPKLREVLRVALDDDLILDLQLHMAGRSLGAVAGGRLLLGTRWSRGRGEACRSIRSCILLDHLIDYG